MMRAPTDPTNADRADWAHEALRRFTGVVCYGNESELAADPESMISDLLGDLMHWADAHEIDFAIALSRGRYHYLYEIAEAYEEAGQFTMAAKFYERAENE